MYKHVLAQPNDKYEIYVNLIDSDAGHYVSRHPYVIGLIKEVLENVKLSKGREVIESNMGRVVGNTDIVETTEKDTIYYAMASKKDVYSRFAKNRYPAPSSTLTIVFKKDAESNYEVTNVWIGPSTPPFPGHEKATVKSKTYWENHALVQDAQNIQSKTITKECPY